MAVSSTAPVANPKTSAYARSPIFRWGVWMLALAAVLIAWNAIKATRIAKPENLRTLEGRVSEYRTGTASQRYGVTSGKRFRGRAHPVNVLRIQTADGKITEFSSADWIHPPTFGWRRGQPIRVKYDSGRDLYEVVVGSEVLQEMATTQQKRSESGKSTQTFAVLLLVIGLPLTAVGYFAPPQGKANPPPPPAVPPPLPGTN